MLPLVAMLKAAPNRSAAFCVEIHRMTPHFTIRACGSRSALRVAIAALLFAMQHTPSCAADAPTQPIQKSSADCSTFRVRAQDEIWLVSTRHLGCPWGYKYVPNLQLWRYQKGTWLPA